MAILLRANTAVDVLIGPFVDEDDGKTAETGLTITQTDIRLSKNGQNIAQKNDANACAHDELGYHNCPLDATDTNTEGQLALCVHESGALPVRHEYNVISEAAWDSMFAAKDDGFMDVNIKTVGRADATETEATNLEAACAAYSVTRGLTGTALPAVAADGVGGVPVSDAGGLDLDAILADTNELQADDYPTSIAAIKAETASIQVETTALDTLSKAAGNGDLAAIKAKTDNLPADPADDSDIDTQLASIKAETALIVADTGTDGVVIATAAIDTAQFAAGGIDAAALAADAANEIRDAIWAKVLETNGNITAQGIMQVALALLAGVTTNDGAVFKTPDGVATRVTITYAAVDNERDNVVLNL